MAAGLKLDDQALSAAGQALVTASFVMVNGNARVPSVQLQSLTGIGARVDLYLRGLAVARAALADAAKTASVVVADLMQESSVLDALIAGNLGTGFAVGKGRS